MSKQAGQQQPTQAQTLSPPHNLLHTLSSLCSWAAAYWRRVEWSDMIPAGLFLLRGRSRRLNGRLQHRLLVAEFERAPLPAMHLLHRHAGMQVNCGMRATPTTIRQCLLLCTKESAAALPIAMNHGRCPQTQRRCMYTAVSMLNQKRDAGYRECWNIGAPQTGNSTERAECNCHLSASKPHQDSLVQRPFLSCGPL